MVAATGLAEWNTNARVVTSRMCRLLAGRGTASERASATAAPEAAAFWASAAYQSHLWGMGCLVSSYCGRGLPVD